MPINMARYANSNKAGIPPSNQYAIRRLSLRVARFHAIKAKLRPEAKWLFEFYLSHPCRTPQDRDAVNKQIMIHLKDWKAIYRAKQQLVRCRLLSKIFISDPQEPDTFLCDFEFTLQTKPTCPACQNKDFALRDYCRNRYCDYHKYILETAEEDYCSMFEP